MQTKTQQLLPEVFSQTLQGFLTSLVGKNRSNLTIQAYKTDVSQFMTYLVENTMTTDHPAKVTKTDIHEYLSYLAQLGLSGISRARKLAAIREYFRFLEVTEVITKSPLLGIATPKKEKNIRSYLKADEYEKILQLAGGNIRDYAILQVFLQTGIRVSELCDLQMDNLDLQAGILKVANGKGMAQREIQLEKKGIQALKNYLNLREQTVMSQTSIVFLNRYGEPISERGIRKLVVRYRHKAGITKKITPHSLRHTFATYKAEHGVSPYQLQQWLGHQSLTTTQIYVHLGKQNAKKVMEQTSL